MGRLAAGVVLLAASLHAQTPSDQPVRLSATFIQLWADHWNWPVARWQQAFRHFNELGLREIYVQWSLYDNVSYFAGAPGSAVSAPPLETILKLAYESGIAVHAGLAFHSGFWENARPGTQLNTYLAVQRQRSLSTAGEIARRYASHPAFAGWYISEEIDDLMWPTGEPRELLYSHLTDLLQGLQRISPSKPVTISGYSGARSDPAQLRAFWAALLERAPFATVMFQDGIGVGNLPIAYVRQYLDAMRQATTAARCDLRVIVEVFRQVDGSFNGRPFRAIPAPFTLILPQMQAAAPYSKDGLVAFSAPEYLTPLGGAEAAQSYNGYIEWMRTTAMSSQTPLTTLASDTRGR